jgi:hypothetical protein
MPALDGVAIGLARLRLVRPGHVLANPAGRDLKYHKRPGNLLRELHDACNCEA